MSLLLTTVSPYGANDKAILSIKSNLNDNLSNICTHTCAHTDGKLTKEGVFSSLVLEKRVQNIKNISTVKYWHMH